MSKRQQDTENIPEGSKRQKFTTTISTVTVITTESDGGESFEISNAIENTNPVQQQVLLNQLHLLQNQIKIKLVGITINS